VFVGFYCDAHLKNLLLLEAQRSERSASAQLRSILRATLVEPDREDGITATP
jgi:plasmid stability protein